MQDYNALKASVVSPSNTSSRSFDLLGGMCPWRYVSASWKLFVAGTSFSCTEFLSYSNSGLSCIHLQSARPHHMTPSDFKDNTIVVCVYVCVYVCQVTFSWLKMQLLLFSVCVGGVFRLKSCLRPLTWTDPRPPRGSWFICFVTSGVVSSNKLSLAR